jgi:hypothetical protein
MGTAGERRDTTKALVFIEKELQRFLWGVGRVVTKFLNEFLFLVQA